MLESPPSATRNPQSRARALLRECGIVAAFAALTVLMTWPWALNWRDAATDLGDPYTIAYNLWWDYYATFSQPLSLFDAPIFYPYRDALAFSEHDYGVALLCFPLFAAGLAPLTVHSLATLAAFALSGYGAFRLARTLTGSRGAAWVAGLCFAFVPYRFHRLPHLHYIFAAWLPLALEALVLFARVRSRGRAAWLFTALTMHGLTCVSWLLLSVVPLTLSAALLITWRRAWRDPALWLRGGLAAAAAALVVLPFLLPYRRVAAAHGFVRGAEEVRSYSATVGQWFSATARNRLWHGLGRDVMTDEAALFPGLLPPLLAICALLFLPPHAPRRRQTRPPETQDGARLTKDGEQLKEADARPTKADAHSAEDGAPSTGDGEGGRRGRLLAAVLFSLDGAAVVAVVVAMLAATYGSYRFELFGVNVVKASHYGRALVLASLLLALRWVLARTCLFHLLARRGLAALTRPGPHGEALALGFVWAAVGFLGSLGMNFFFHRLLFEHVELFRSQRVPARWSMIAYVGLSLLAGLGARQLAELYSRRAAQVETTGGARTAGGRRGRLSLNASAVGARMSRASVFTRASDFTRRFTRASVFARRTARASIFVVLCAALLYEQRAAPLELVRGQAEPDQLTLRLKETEMAGGVAHLPVFGRGGRDFEHVLRAADHRRPLVTASTSFVPPLVTRLHELSRRRPVPAEFLDALEAVPVSYLVVGYSQMTLEEFEATRALLREAVAGGRLRFCGRFEDRGLKDLFAVVKTEPRATAAGEFSPPEIKIRLGAQPGVATAAVAGLTPELDAAGPLLARFYKAAYGRAPSYAEFARDLPRLTAGVDFARDDWPRRLEESAARFAAELAAREEFRAAHDAETPRGFVGSLAAGAGGRVSQARRETISRELEAGEETRAGALLRVVGDEEFARAERDPSFVLLHYFAFLERDPDPGGYEAWLRALERDPDRAAFTRAFTGSIEYQNKQRGK